MTEYYNDPSELYDEELIKKQEKNDELPDYDIFDLGEADTILEERKAQHADEEKATEPEIIEVSSEQIEGAENVTKVLPPYRRETTERSTEDVTELSRKRNHESYDATVEDKPIVEKVLYTEPELEMGIDELLESLGIHVDVNELPIEESVTEAVEKTQVIGDLSSEKAEADDDGATRHFVLTEKKEEERDIGSTRHFNLNNIKPDRAEAEQKLKASRKKLMQNFRVLSRKYGDEAILEAIPTGDGKESMMDNVWAEDGEDLFDAVEKAERRKKRHSLKEEKKKAVVSGKAAEEELKKKLKTETIQLVSLGVVFVMSLILGFIPGVIASADMPPEKLPSVGTFVLLNMLLLAASVFISKEYYRSAATSLYYMVADGDTCLLIAAAFAFLQQLFTLIFQSKFDLASLKMFTSVAVFAAAMRVLCDYFRTNTALRGIMTLMENDGISCIQEVESRTDSAVLAHGLSEDGKPKLLYCAQTEMKEGVATDITAIKTEDKYYSYASIASVAVAFVVAVVSLIKTKDFPTFLVALSAGMGITLPVMCDTAASAMSYFQNLKLAKIGAAATSYETIREIGKSNAIIMDASDIFMGVVSKFKRVPSGRIAKSDSVVFAAATLKKAGSILSGCFDEIIDQMGITLPEAEDFAYEEKLGYSCWIADRRVLVGNRQMLIEHSIPAPTEYEEKQYAGKGSVMYVVVEGALTATFVISYRVLSKARKVSSAFASTGLVLMLTTKEPCLTEGTVSSALGISVTKVKLVNTKGTGIMERYRENKAMRKSAGVFCSGKSGSLLALAAEAHRIYTANKLLFVLHIGSHAVAAALMLLAALWDITAFMSPLFVIFWLLLWSGATIAYTQKESLIKFIKEIIKKTGKKANI